MQRLLDIRHPCGGAIFARTIRHSPARLRAGVFMHLAIECEIAVTLGADLPVEADSYKREAVAAVVGSYSAAIELVEDRWAAYQNLSAIDLVADNAWNTGIVLGASIIDWRSLDLASITGTRRINGVVVGTDSGGDVRHHPFEVVAWLANMLLERGKLLRAIRS